MEGEVYGRVTRKQEGMCPRRFEGVKAFRIEGAPEEVGKRIDLLALQWQLSKNLHVLVILSSGLLLHVVMVEVCKVLWVWVSKVLLVQLMLALLVVCRLGGKLAVMESLESLVLLLLLVILLWWLVVQQQLLLELLTKVVWVLRLMVLFGSMSVLQL